MGNSILRTLQNILFGTCDTSVESSSPSNLIENDQCEVLKCKMWKITTNDFTYPETLERRFMEKNDIGVCLPGGGIRACVYSLGVLRGLHKLGVLQKTKYITSVSGSSWLTSVFSYQHLCSTTDFLGDYIEPSELSMKHLSCIKNQHEFANVLHDISVVTKICGNYVEEKVVDVLDGDITNMSDCWSQTVGESMYEAYGLNDFVSIPCLTKKSNSYAHLQELRLDVPFPIIRGCVEHDITSCKTDIEFTPLYYGMQIQTPGIVGSGIYFEPLGMLTFSKKCTVKDNAFEFNPDECVNNVISILKTGGISSNNIPMNIKMHDKTYEFFELPNVKFFDQQLMMIDGGARGEYNGIPSLLQRRVKNIVFVCPIQSSDNVEYSNKDMIDLNTDLFEHFSDSSDSQLFSSRHSSQLKDAFYRLIDQNKPLVVKMCVEVVSNTKYGVILKQDEVYIPTITFIHPIRSKWMDKLPLDTKKYIKNNVNNFDNTLSLTNLTNATFMNFPFNRYTHLNYSIELVNAMSQNACYDIVSNAALFE